MPKISELTVTTGLTTGDYFVIVQSGNSRKIKIDDFYASINIGARTTSAGRGVSIGNANAGLTIDGTGSDNTYKKIDFLNACASADSGARLYVQGLSNDNATGFGIFWANSTDSMVYFNGLISAASVVDRTPIYTGDAITELSAIQEKDGIIDHQTLPAFIQKTYTNYLLDKDGKSIAVPETGRSLGGAVSMLITAVQQLSQGNKDVVISINGITCSLNDMNESMKKLDERIKAIEKPVSTLAQAS